MSLFEDTYITIESKSEGFFKDRGSKFISYAFPVQTDKEALKHLAEIKTLHPKATHHCYAYKLGMDSTAFRVNDDGEPSNTAGRPILNQILSENLTDMFVVVVRYYGGTNLGIPGLINAYKSACQNATFNAKMVQRVIMEDYQIRFDYDNMGTVMAIINREKLEMKNQNFVDTCTLDISVRKNDANKVYSLFSEIPKTKIVYLH